MRTSAGRGDAEEALSVRAARLLRTRSRFHRDQTSVEPDGDAKRYLGENGGTGAVPSLIIWDDTEIVPPSEHGKRVIDSREHFFFPEDFEQVIKARAGVASGNRETGRMDNRANLYPKLFRGRFHRSFNVACRKIFDSAKSF